MLTPRPSDRQSGALPLSYACTADELEPTVGFEPTACGVRDRRSSVTSYIGVETRAGIEPAMIGFANRRLTVLAIASF